MTIAAHISIPGNKPSAKNFNYHILGLLATTYPEHHFIFIFDRQYDTGLITSSNITPVLLAPEIKNPLLRHYWYNYKLPRVLTKYNADVFISNGIVCSLHTKVKQCMFVPDLSFLQKNNLHRTAERRYLKRYLRKFIGKAEAILVSNEHLIPALLSIDPQVKNRLEIINYDFGISAETIDRNKAQNIKDRWSDGKEYFIFFVTDASAQYILIMLKAFSIFKKRQLSNMQLLLSISSSKKEVLIKDLATYKYREEVKSIIVESERIEKELTAAAYAAIYLPAVEILEDKGLLAIKNNTPLITTGTMFSKAFFHDSVLYTDMDEKSIAEKMMILYKDENLRHARLMSAASLAELYLPSRTAAKLWQVVTTSAAQSS